MDNLKSGSESITDAKDEDDEDTKGDYFSPNLDVPLSTAKTSEEKQREVEEYNKPLPEIPTAPGFEEAYELIKCALPLNRINVLYPRMARGFENVVKLLYKELRESNFDLEKVVALKSRSKRTNSMSVESVLDDAGIDSNEFKNRFKSNPQEREDLEAYVVLVAVLLVKHLKPDPWVEKYEDIASFREAYPEFDDEHDENVIFKLILFANVMHNGLRYMRGKGNQQRLLTLVACLAEGPSHSRYITGGAQSRKTSRRVCIFRKESNTSKVPRPHRGAKGENGEILQVPEKLEPLRGKIGGRNTVVLLPPSNTSYSHVNEHVHTQQYHSSNSTAPMPMGWIAPHRTTPLTGTGTQGGTPKSGSSSSSTAVASSGSTSGTPMTVSATQPKPAWAYSGPMNITTNSLSSSQSTQMNPNGVAINMQGMAFPSNMYTNQMVGAPYGFGPTTVPGNPIPMYQLKSHVLPQAGIPKVSGMPMYTPQFDSTVNNSHLLPMHARNVTSSANNQPSGISFDDYSMDPITEQLAVIKVMAAKDFQKPQCEYFLRVAVKWNGVFKGHTNLIPFTDNAEWENEIFELVIPQEIELAANVLEIQLWQLHLERQDMIILGSRKLTGDELIQFVEKKMDSDAEKPDDWPEKIWMRLEKHEGDMECVSSEGSKKVSDDKVALLPRILISGAVENDYLLPMCSGDDYNDELFLGVGVGMSIGIDNEHSTPAEDEDYGNDDDMSDNMYESNIDSRGGESSSDTNEARKRTQKQTQNVQQAQQQVQYHQQLQHHHQQQQHLQQQQHQQQQMHLQQYHQLQMQHMQQQQQSVQYRNQQKDPQQNLHQSVNLKSEDSCENTYPPRAPTQDSNNVNSSSSNLEYNSDSSKSKCVASIDSFPGHRSSNIAVDASPGVGVPIGEEDNGIDHKVTATATTASTTSTVSAAVTATKTGADRSLVSVDKHSNPRPDSHQLHAGLPLSLPNEKLPTPTQVPVQASQVPRGPPAPGPIYPGGSVGPRPMHAVAMGMEVPMGMGGMSMCVGGGSMDGKQMGTMGMMCPPMGMMYPSMGGMMGMPMGMPMGMQYMGMGMQNMGMMQMPMFGMNMGLLSGNAGMLQMPMQQGGVPMGMAMGMPGMNVGNMAMMNRGHPAIFAHPGNGNMGMHGMEMMQTTATGSYSTTVSDKEQSSDDSSRKRGRPKNEESGSGKRRAMNANAEIDDSEASDANTGLERGGDGDPDESIPNNSVGDGTGKEPTGESAHIRTAVHTLLSLSGVN